MKPCPFCGGRAAVGRTPEGWRVVCGKCGAQSAAKAGVAEVQAAWDARPRRTTVPDYPAAFRDVGIMACAAPREMILAALQGLAAQAGGNPPPEDFERTLRRLSLWAGGPRDPTLAGLLRFAKRQGWLVPAKYHRMASRMV